MLDIRIWEVGAGLAVRIVTPTGHNHMIDAGCQPGFSPAIHIYTNYWRAEHDHIDFLIISHQDRDHIEDLPEVVRLLGEPRVFLRNKSVPPEEKYGSRQLEYQTVLEGLDSRFNAPIPFEQSPQNPAFSGVTIKTWMNPWTSCFDNINNASVVASYEYANTAVVFPGDIEPDGWAALTYDNLDLLQTASLAATRILVAPHHGRGSGYSQDMIDLFRPHLVIISDGHGAGATDRRFQTAGSGINFGGELKKYLTTKTGGRKRLTISPDGLLTHYLSD